MILTNYHLAKHFTNLLEEHARFFFWVLPPKLKRDTHQQFFLNYSIILNTSIQITLQ